MAQRIAPPEASPQQGRRPKYTRSDPKIPIVDTSLRIVGWTKSPPEVIGTSLRHVEAETLLGRPVVCVYVQLVDGNDAIAAGAPATWTEPWRCLAIGPEGVAAHNSPAMPGVMESFIGRRRT